MISRAWGWLVLLAAIFGGTHFLILPAPLPGNAPPGEFSAERAMRHVRRIAQAPHMIGSRENERVRDYLVAELESLGLEVAVQEVRVVYDHPRRREHSPRIGWPVNILARLPGTGEGPALALMSHYDSAASAPGAADAGSGVATILETVRAVTTTDAPRLRDMLVILTDGEEVGLMGAQGFLRQHGWAREIGLLINLEARGAAGPAFMFETGPKNGALIGEFARAAPYPVGNSFGVDVYRRMPNDTDATIVADAGIPFLNFAFIDDFFRYHAGTDRPDNLSRRTLQQEGSNTLALARHFLAADELPDRAADATFFNLTAGWLVRYGELTTWLLGLAAVLGAGLAVVSAWRTHRLKLRGLAGAFLGLAAAAAAAYWIVTGIHGLLVASRPPFAFFYTYHSLGTGYAVLTVALAAGLWNDDPRVRRSFAALAAAAILALSVALDRLGWGPLVAAGLVGAYGLLGARTPSMHHAVATLALWLVGLLAMLVLAPHASYLAAWPLVLASGFWFVLRRSDQAPLGLLIPWLWIWSSVLYTGYLALGVFQPGSVMIAITLILGVGASWLGRSRIEAPVLATAALAVLVVAASNANSDSDRPRPTELFYALDANGNQAWWATRETHWPGWAESELGLPNAEINAAVWFPGSERSWPALSSAPLPLGEPRLQTDLSTDGSGFRIELTLSAPSGPERIDLTFPAANYLAGSVEGEPVPLARDGEAWHWRLYAPPDRLTRIRVEGRGAPPNALHLTAIHYVSPGAVAAEFPDSPADTMATIWGFHRATLIARTIALSPR